MGGRPGLTKSLRVAYQKYNIDAQSTGQQAMDWPQWLEQNGYQLDESGLVKQAPKDQTDAMQNMHRPYL